MIQSFPRRMVVPMAERLTIARLCLRPTPSFARLISPPSTLPRPYPATPIFRFKVPPCAPGRNLANFYYLRPIFQSATAHARTGRKVALGRVAHDSIGSWKNYRLEESSLFDWLSNERKASSLPIDIRTRIRLYLSLFNVCFTHTHAHTHAEVHRKSKRTKDQLFSNLLLKF